MLLVAAMLAAGAPSALSANAEPAAPQSTQQSKGTCKGTVSDSEGEPMVGASVVVLGTTIGGSTNIDGQFSLANVPMGSSIRISYVGFEPVTLTWNGQDLNVELKDNNLLDEVVVVGFGTQKKVNLTGAVSTVSAKEIANRPISSVADALQGVVPGLNVMSSSLGGQINGTRSMNIRGTGTIGTGASVTPLILIDGMEGALETVAPQDVENISVLKDASASSIYGSRAAGGVILVTTKKGKEGRVSVSYSDSFRWSHNIRMPKKMSSYDYAVMMNEGSINNGDGDLAWCRLDIFVVGIISRIVYHIGRSWTGSVQKQDIRAYLYDVCNYLWVRNFQGGYNRAGGTYFRCNVYRFPYGSGRDDDPGKTSDTMECSLCHCCRSTFYTSFLLAETDNKK